MYKLRNLSPWLSIASTAILSLGLIFANSGINIDAPAITETLIAICAALTTAGVITSPKTTEEHEDEDQGEQDKTSINEQFE